MDTQESDSFFKAMEDKFVAEAKEVGFTEGQAKFLYNKLKSSSLMGGLFI